MPTRDPSLTHESILAAMAIPSSDRMRGLKDGVGFATTAEQMAAVVAASARAPEPRILGPAPDNPVIGVICPHDDFLYAGRVYHRALESIQAKTIVVIGTFHGWRKFAHALGWFDRNESWFAPDGPVPVSPLREAVRTRLGPFARPYAEDNAAFDHEHSIEPIVAWLKHRNPAVEILPILPPSDEGSIDNILISAQLLGGALDKEMNERGLELGRDVAVVISADAIHYGPDFQQTRYGEGREAYERAVEEDLRILGMLDGDLDPLVSIPLYETFVDPKSDGQYRWTWCGRYAIPFGIVFLWTLAGRLKGWPLAYATSLDPPLPVNMPPLGFTAPASYDHFVGYPAVAFTFA